MRQLKSLRLRRIMTATVAVVCVGIAAIGWMHTHTGRMLLAKLGLPCPVNQVEPKRVMAVREDAIARSRGTAPAPSRPALGLQLDVSTDVQVSAWAARTHSECVTIARGYQFLRCRAMSAAALGVAGPPVSEIWFSFGPNHTLIAINLYRRNMTEAETQQSWRTAVQRLRESLGTPTQSTGDLTLDSLVNSPVSVARVRYTYADYIATITASHMPYGGLAVREQYMSAVSGPSKDTLSNGGAG
jgi:hypothetical protein